MPVLAAILLVGIWGATFAIVSREAHEAQARVIHASQRLSETYVAQTLRALAEITQVFKLIEYAYASEGGGDAGSKGSGAGRDDGRVLAQLRERNLLLPELLFTTRIIGPAGQVLASTRASGFTLPVDQEMMRQHRAGVALHVGRPQMGARGDDPIIEFSRSIGGQGEKFTHVVSISAPASYLVSGYDDARFGREGLLAVLGTDLVLRAHRVGPLVQAGQQVVLPPAMASFDAEEPEVALIHSPLDGVLRYVSLRPLYGFPLAIVVGLSEAEQLAPTRSDAQQLMLGATALSLVVVLIASVLVWLSWRLSRVHAREAAAQVARTEAEQSSVAKSQFLANMSHELRTPMNAILGMLQLLSATALTARQTDYVKKTDGAARSLLYLLNDILDFSKVEAGKMTIDNHPFRLNHMLRDLSVIVAASRKSKQIEVLFDIDSSIPNALVGDGQRLLQVLINLLSNAIKFTERGEVVLTMVLRHDDAGLIELAVSVSDTGLGIAQADRERIFTSFTQAEGSTTRRFGGTGLGLAISQRLVQLLGGQLSVESELGRGSTFSFAVPMQRQGEHAADTIRHSEGLQVLFIDDNPKALAVFKRAALALGWHASTAGNEAEALTWLNGHSCQAIFADWHMPEMLQGSLRARLSELAQASSISLVAMVSADGSESSAAYAEASRAGFQAIALKPLIAHMLHDAFTQTLSPNVAVPITGVEASAAHEPLLRGLRVLVVEDNINNQQVAQELLEGEGATVQLAADGQAGVTAVEHAHPPFDAVLMDMQMPVMDGLSATRDIRGRLGLAKLPIIAMTANAMASDRAACLAAGMNDHVGKPFDFRQLVQCLLMHTGREGAGHAVAPQANALAVPSELLSNAQQHGIDLSAALDRMGGQVKPYARMLTGFLAELSTWDDGLDAEIAAHQHEQLARRLHTIKGLAATVGANTLSGHAAALEQVYKGLKDDAVPRTDAPALRRTLHEAVAQAQRDLGEVARSLGALVRTQEAARPSAEAGPGDTAALRSQLDELVGLLAKADMRAIDVHASIQVPHVPAWAAQFEQLDQAMAALDFQSARAGCQALLSELGGGVPSERMGALNVPT